MDDLMPEIEPHAFGKSRPMSRAGMSKMSKKVSQTTSKALHDDARSVQHRSSKRPNLIAKSQAKAPKLGIPDLPASSS